MCFHGYTIPSDGRYIAYNQGEISKHTSPRDPLSSETERLPLFDCTFTAQDQSSGV